VRQPDGNSPLTAFVCAEFLELGTLGPLTRLQPGAAFEQAEHRHLPRDVPSPATDADVEAGPAPRVRALDGEAQVAQKHDKV
jgi:hypothetical protein